MSPRPLALAAVLLVAACGSGSDGSSSEETGRVAAAGSGDAQTARLEMNDRLQFVPNVVTAEVGRLTLDLVNVGKIPHDLQFDDKALPASGSVRGGKSESLEVRFTQPGTYTFVCTFHPGMDGRVEVTATGGK